GSVCLVSYAKRCRSPRNWPTTLVPSGISAVTAVCLSRPPPPCDRPPGPLEWDSGRCSPREQAKHRQCRVEQSRAENSAAETDECAFRIVPIWHPSFETQLASFIST